MGGVELRSSALNTTASEVFLLQQERRGRRRQSEGGVELQLVKGTQA